MTEPGSTDQHDPTQLHSTCMLTHAQASMAGIRESVRLRQEDSNSRQENEASNISRNEQEHKDTIESLNTTYKTNRRQARDQGREQVKSIEKRHKKAMEKLRTDYERALESIDERITAQQSQTSEKLQWRQFRAEALYEEQRDQPKIEYERLRDEIQTLRERLRQLTDQAKLLLNRYKQKTPRLLPYDPEIREKALRHPRQAMIEQIKQANAGYEDLAALKVPRAFIGPVILVPWVILVLLGVLTMLPTGLDYWIQFLLGFGIGTLIFIVLLAIVYTIATRQVTQAYQPIRIARDIFDTAAERLLADADAKRQLKEAQKKIDMEEDVTLAKEKYQPQLQKIEQMKQDRIDAIQSKLPEMEAAEVAEYEKTLSEAKDAAEQAMNQLEHEYTMAIKNEKERYNRTRDVIKAESEKERTRICGRWHDSMNTCLDQLQQVGQQCASMFPSWNDQIWSDQELGPQMSRLDSIPIGSVRFDLADIEGGIPEEDDLKLDREVSMDVPAMLSFPERSSLLAKSAATGREESLSLIQEAMLRLLTSLPPGKVQFTIMDPVALGQNFAAFMHLEDEAEGIVGDRIWTDPRQIENRLNDLCEHMETVIQKYLRNEFDTIEQYNEKAGEIAEPFRYLVIADFPTNFTDVAAQKLLSIISSGTKCGVYTLIHLDTRQPLPSNVKIEDLEAGAIVIEATDHGLTFNAPEYAELEFTPSEPPATDFMIDRLRTIGRLAKDANRVEVPFKMIAPSSDENLWSRSSADILTVELGRSGATKFQSLVLGEGTAQHALIAGKTGSGKSTLLHAMITNLALWYSPDEVEFYLIDFKKGVEFKTYAGHELPHARAVAIESDREFGLSVLKGLDAELKKRGELYRDAGVQDLKGYRQACPDQPMPRTLLIIDEFQEIFVEDDKLSQDASLLLDRLVRQGRAFGIHVILGSQTLGGAYSLPRTTMGQMAIRIALQCNEADSQLILSDENAAARLLSRPGEAIYNDTGGLPDGNNPFQVCWLPESVRDEYLGQVETLAKTRPHHPVAAPIVFEGNTEADLQANPQLESLLQEKTWPERPSSPRAWLGDAIAIKDPTAAVFRRQSGSNFILVGQRDEQALAISTASLLSLAAQVSPADGFFWILDGTPADDEHAGLLASVAERLPHAHQVVPWRSIEQAMRTIAAEIQSRQEADDIDRPSGFVLIHCLHRYRMLRRNEDDFSFGDSATADSPSQLLGFILREGPVYGIHVLSWCDTVTNLHRTLDRNSLREFDYRGLFQLSGTDSSTLIDSPLGSRLGPHRALLYNEELGQMEKFRPYSIPSGPVMDSILDALGSRKSAGSAEMPAEASPPADTTDESIGWDPDS